MKIILIVISVIGALVLLLQVYFIMAKTETQTYQVIESMDDFEIRMYPSATMASVSMKANSYKNVANSGFRKLANFIFGGNQSDKSISMTTPVHMDINDEESSVSFVMPAEYNMDNLPKPKDASVKISNSEKEYVAAIQFSGYADDQKIKKYSDQLKKLLDENGIEYYGNFRFLGYNAPYQFLGRRNEIIVSVVWEK